MIETVSQIQICEWCNSEFRPRSNKRFCTSSCKLKAWRAKREGKSYSNEPQTVLVICPRCKSQVKDANFCGRCGNRLRDVFLKLPIAKQQDRLNNTEKSVSTEEKDRNEPNRDELVYY